MSKMSKAFVGGVLLLLATASLALAAWTPEDFNAFTGSGFAPSPAAGQLDSDAWIATGLSDGNGAWGAENTSGDFARGTSAGSVTTGGVYAFEVATGDYALGVQPSSADFTPGSFKLRVENDTGATITQLYVEYEIWVRNDQGYANSFNFSYSTDDSTYTAVAALDYTSPEAADASPTWTQTDRSTTITGLNLAPNDYFYLQWTSNDVSGSGSRDEFALDDVEVRVDDATAVKMAHFNKSLSPLASLAAALFFAASIVVLRKKR